MEKILVTGASGFVGQYVVAELIRSGYSVIASSADPEKAGRSAWFGQAAYIPLDLSAFDPATGDSISGPDTDYFRRFGEPDRLIHLAWEGLPNYKDSFHTDVNYPRHAAFLENLVRHGLRDMTVIGTCLEYGMQEGELGEDLPPRPANPYALAKDMLRRRLLELQPNTPFTFRWARLFYMYGKGQNPKSLLSQLDQALEAGAEVFNMSGGEQVRDYLPVEAVAGYIVRIALQNDVTGIINCCSGQPVAVKDFVADYLRRNHKKISLNLGYYPYPDYEPMRFWGKNTKLKTILKDE
jgi:dTDP-6-deoxy-L-talose 4-dehydrogenase (NAD+)